MSSAKKDYYEVLNVNRNADVSEIKKSYRRLAHLYHPDKNPDNKEAEENFKEIREAYHILSDTQKRSQYDNFGHAGMQGDSFNSSSVNINDVFGDFFGDIFGNKPNTNSPQEGNDLHYKINISFKESVFGIKKTIKILRKEICKICQGSGSKPGTYPTVCRNCNGRGEINMMRGFFAISQACPKCNGMGKYITNPCIECNGTQLKKVNKNIEVNVPAGIDNGMRLKISHEGESGFHGGSMGNLYISVFISDHPIFKRKEYDILCDIPITCIQAILGSNITVPTINGKVDMKIPSGTQPGTIFRLRKKGIPSLRIGNKRGDQLVRIQVEIPKIINNKQKILINEFSTSLEEKSFPKSQNFSKKIKDIIE